MSDLTLIIQVLQITLLVLLIGVIGAFGALMISWYSYLGDIKYFLEIIRKVRTTVQSFVNRISEGKTQI